MQGGVGTMFAYGQTGSGKTHTISGLVERLAKELWHRPGLTVSLTCIELLGSNASDLLAEQPGARLEILEDKFGQVRITDYMHFYSWNTWRQVNIVGAEEAELSGPAEFLAAVARAAARRNSCSTAKSEHSSRTHAVLPTLLHCVLSLCWPGVPGEADQPQVPQRGPRPPHTGGPRRLGDHGRLPAPRPRPPRAD